MPQPTPGVSQSDMDILTAIRLANQLVNGMTSQTAIIQQYLNGQISLISLLWTHLLVPPGATLGAMGSGIIPFGSGTSNLLLVMPYDYDIAFDGTYYIAVNNQNIITFGGINKAGGVSGTDPQAVLQNAINAVGNKGRINFHANMSMNCSDGTPISIVGAGHYNYGQGNMIELIGSGWTTTISQTVPNVDLFQLSNAAQVHIQGIRLDINCTSASSGNCITGLDNGANTLESVTFSQIDMVLFTWSGVAGTGYAMDLKNPMWCTFGLLIIAFNNSPNSIRIQATDPNQVIGNTTIGRIIASNPSGGYVLTLQALVGPANTSSASGIDYVRVGAIDSTSAGDGILITADYGAQIFSNEFHGIDLECANGHQILAQIGTHVSPVTGNYAQIYNNMFWGEVLAISSATPAITMPNRAHGNSFWLEVAITTPGTSVAVSDSNTILGKNKYWLTGYGWAWNTVSISWVDITITGADSGGNPFTTPYRSTFSITNSSQTSVVCNIGGPFTPNWALAAINTSGLTVYILSVVPTAAGQVTIYLNAALPSSGTTIFTVQAGL